MDIWNFWVRKNKQSCCVRVTFCPLQVLHRSSGLIRSPWRKNSFTVLSSRGGFWQYFACCPRPMWAKISWKIVATLPKSARDKSRAHLPHARYKLHIVTYPLGLLIASTCQSKLTWLKGCVNNKQCLRNHWPRLFGEQSTCLSPTLATHGLHLAHNPWGQVLQTDLYVEMVDGSRQIF